MEGRHTTPKHTAAPSGRTGMRAATAQPRRTAETPTQRQTAPERPARVREAQTIYRPDDERAERKERLAPRPEKKKRPSAAGMILRDILLVGIILVVFAFFHHVLPRITARNTVIAPKSTVVSATTPPPAETSGPAPVQQAVPENEEPPEETQEPLPEEVDLRTEWQKRFADKFTDEVIRTADSYSSPDVAVSISTYSGEYKGYYQTYYVADIYVANIENFRTRFANDQFVYYGAQDAVALSKSADAILAMNGDYCNNQRSGFLVRNGDVYYDDALTFDLCVLFHDGRVETYSPSEYDPQELLEAGPYQTWKFGPKLLDEDGKAMTSFNTTTEIIYEEAPRSGFGYYEPGHYCFVVADGRQNHARGFVLSEFAQLFEELGCTRAYNMDGGASSVLTFDGSTYNKPSGYRQLGDILLIAEISGVSREEEGTA
ncbi:MAG: phosphodiester glycosidase family protein [Oscillospiraceae bacterium]|nr:phosphodiester glycosidase family protein [Oscillospiraceae bacterium]